MSSSSIELPRWIDLVVLPLVNLALALLACGIVVAVVGHDPWQVLALLVQGAFGSRMGLSYTLYYATTFVFTGLAVAVAFHAGLFNIGGEGQAMMGGLGTALAALALAEHLPRWAMLPLMIGAAMLLRHGLGRGAGGAAGLARQPRGDHHHHVQLHRVGAARLPAGRRAQGARQHDGGEPRPSGPRRTCPACTKRSPRSASNGRPRRST